MKATVTVMLKSGVLDPQGEAVRLGGGRVLRKEGAIGRGAVLVALLGKVQFTQRLVQQVLVVGAARGGDAARALQFAEHDGQYAQAVAYQFLLGSRQRLHRLPCGQQLVQAGAEGVDGRAVVVLLVARPALHVQRAGVEGCVGALCDGL